MTREVALQYLLARMTEPSSIRGAVQFIGGLTEMTVSQSTENSVVGMVFILAGLIGMLTKDSYGKPK